ncbi:MAG: SGNH/GDSL hydrolase family protein [Clostridia bacterium]|nr:SGNH/GDSL hydrolase family protein [Clostridia bacterium]
MNEIYGKDELPLQSLSSLPADGGFTGIFRKIGCIGDSLSSGEFQAKNEAGSPTYHDCFDYSWGQYMARIAGTTVVNMSRGGMTAKEYFDSFATDNGYWKDAETCDAIIIALGVNDVSQILAGNLEMGENTDFDPKRPFEAKNTFFGYMARIIYKIKGQNPYCHFFLVTLPDENGDSARETLNGLHRERIYQLAEMFSHIHVIDLRKYAPVYGKEFRSHFFLDGHMNPAGYLFTAKLMCGYIDYIVRHEPDMFMQVAFTHSPIFHPDYFK